MGIGLAMMMVFVAGLVVGVSVMLYVSNDPPEEDYF